MQTPAASEVYQPPEGNQLVDSAYAGHYPEQGYSVSYVHGPDGQPVPEGGNTAILRLFPHAVTEPFHVTAKETDSTYTLNVLSGIGQVIRARANGEVDQVPLVPGTPVVIHPGETLAYQNTGDEELIVHDVAMPAYRGGDTADLRSSLIPKVAPQLEEGYTSTVVLTDEGEKVINIPDHFTELVTNALRELKTERQRQVPKFFAELESRIQDVPELGPAVEYAKQNPEKAYKLFSQYVEVVRKLARMDRAETDYIQSSWDKLQAARTKQSSASHYNALNILGELDDEQRKEMAKDATMAINPESPYLEPALADFVTRTEGGHQMKLRGDTPQDGDPESDKVIWGHTQITDPEALLHFTMAHYMERYFSQSLAAQGVEFAAHQKDYFLNAITDVLMLDHFSNSRFAEILSMWAKPRDQGGLGWTKTDRFAAYLP